MRSLFSWYLVLVTNACYSYSILPLSNRLQILLALFILNHLKLMRYTYVSSNNMTKNAEIPASR